MHHCLKISLFNRKLLQRFQAHGFKTRPVKPRAHKPRALGSSCPRRLLPNDRTERTKAASRPGRNPPSMMNQRPAFLTSISMACKSFTLQQKRVWSPHGRWCTSQKEPHVAFLWLPDTPSWLLLPKAGTKSRVDLVWHSLQSSTSCCSSSPPMQQKATVLVVVASHTQ